MPRKRRVVLQDNDEYQYEEREARAGEYDDKAAISASDETSIPYPPLSAILSTEIFDFIDADEETLERLLEKIKSVAVSHRPLYLNWELRFQVPDGEEEWCQDGLVTPEQCGLEAGDTQFSLPFHWVSTHFSMDVTVGSRSQNPFNAVVFHGAGLSSIAIFVRGYYAGQVYLVPTADQVELRPIDVAGAGRAHTVMPLS